MPLVFHSSGELELALKLKTSLFYHVCADWRHAGHAEIQGLGEGAQQTEISPRPCRDDICQWRSGAH